jgi:divalent metal cation (Fe/Co/Zn/Cd) transporter
VLDGTVCLVAVLAVAGGYFEVQMLRPIIAIAVPFLIIGGVVALFFHAKHVWHLLKQANGPHSQARK